MNKSYDVAALGELLIDFTEAGVSADGRRLFEQNPGGAPANFLTAATHMGYKAAFLGKVGTDMHGKFLKEILDQEGICTDYLVMDGNYFTTLAFVSIDTTTGEREFSFARKPGADTCLAKEELDEKILSDCKVFHVGSLSLTDEPVKSATYEAVKRAKAAGAMISYDPNYRAPLWNSVEEAVEEIKGLIPYADVMKVSDEEAGLLTGLEDYGKAAEQILAMGPKLVAVTLGGDGVLVATKDHQEIVPGFKVKAVDTTGAGDSFWGGFVSAYLGYEKAIEEMQWEEWTRCARFGNAVAALCVQKRGGIPAIPQRAEVLEMLGE